CARSKGYPDQW
nr:immunoglobulin heavy chain junction region [Mus musculus]MBK4197985.1 immunoglobulin heavy chain junction region [Mus musculus]